MRSGCAASLPVCAAESLSRLNISVISFPQAIKSPQTAQLKGKWFNHWDNLYKRPLTGAWDLHLGFVLLLRSFSKPPLDSCEVSNLSAKFGWILAVNWYSLALVSTMTLRWERMKCYSSLSIAGWISLLRINSSRCSTWVYLFSIAVCTSCPVVCSRHTICVSCIKTEAESIAGGLERLCAGVAEYWAWSQMLWEHFVSGETKMCLRLTELTEYSIFKIKLLTHTQGWMQHVHICCLGIFKSILGNVWNH